MRSAGCSPGDGEHWKPKELPVFGNVMGTTVTGGGRIKRRYTLAVSSTGRG
jgi:hypothetical protein